MKKEEVPQDSKYLEPTTLRDLYYAVDSNGRYVPVSSVGWEAQNEALSITWENIAEEAEATRNEALLGQTSPLAYHMEINLLTPGLLSSYSGISRKNIRKHLNPDAFKALDDDTLQKYANAFGITVEQLKTV
ncbi:MAG: hypothetical protein LBC81_00350 [Tannerellaceae bacterium]|jgi:hypothetical protein|nr:hypothetical protein [Tannerellaceae bacterium]